MATENSEKNDPAPGGADRPMTMKERLLAQRAADAAKATGAPPVPASRPAPAPRAPSVEPGASAMPPPPSTPRAAEVPPTGIPAAAGVASSRAKATPAAGAKPADAKPAAAKSAAAKPASSKPAAAKPAAAKASEPRTGKREINPELQRELEMLKKRQDRPVVIGGIVAGVLLVGALAAFFVSKQVEKNRKETAANYEKSLDQVVVDARAFGIEKEDDAKKTVDFVKSKEELWKGTRVSGDMVSLVNRANAAIEKRKEIRTLQDSLANVESTVRDAATKKAEELAQMRRSLAELDQARDKVSVEFGTRVDAAKLAVDRAYVERLHEEAKTIAGKGATEARAALTAYTKVEDEVVALLDRAYNQKNEDNKKHYSEKLKEIIGESDAIVTQVFVPDVVDKTPWTELLTGEQAKQWANDGLKGFRVENGQLVAVGPDVGSRTLGIMSIGDREKWRDFQIECEYTIVKGGVSFWFRLGKRADNTVENVTLSTVGNDSLRAGQPYGFVCTFIGSHIKFQPTDADLSGYENDVSWTKGRRGAFGITLPEGSEIKVTKLRIRALR